MITRLLPALALAITLSSCDVISQLPATYGTITESEAAEGLRQALDQGVGKGISYLGRQDGFLGNETYKLLLPPDAQKVENTLRQLGMGGMVDRAITQINRGAEDAVSAARPIFVDAIRAMTITDAINIIKGSNTSGTDYFRQKTTDRLVSTFTPIIKSSLDKFSATKYYNEVITTYNNFPTTMQKINPDLTNYVVNRAVTALFDQIAQEEMNIRANPAARTTEILRKVFGWAARA